MMTARKKHRELRTLCELPLSQIKCGKNQPRTTFDEYELAMLTESIRQNGLLQPVSVRRSTDGYELIAGERRVRACKAAGLLTIPAIVYEVGEEAAAVYTLIENLQRSDLSLFDTAEGIKRLISVYGISQADAAERLGIAQSTLSNKLRILRFTPAQRRRMETSRLTERHARALLRLPPERCDEALDTVIANELTVKETDSLVEEMLLPEEKKREPYRRAAIGDVRLFANSLSKIVDTMIKAGYTAKTKKNETDSYIEYTVRIDKKSAQLRLL